jgi:hypothetical protein
LSAEFARFSRSFNDDAASGSGVRTSHFPEPSAAITGTLWGGPGRRRWHLARATPDNLNELQSGPIGGATPLSPIFLALEFYRRLSRTAGKLWEFSALIPEACPIAAVRFGRGALLGRQGSMKTQLLGWTVATFALVLLLGFGTAGEKDKKDEKPKFKIPEVMKEVMKSGVAKKVFAGEGTKEETAKVLEMFVSLHASKPPKDENDNWAKVTKTLVSTAQAIADGKEKGSKKLAAIINCGACHKEFKK